MRFILIIWPVRGAKGKVKSDDVMTRPELLVLLCAWRQVLYLDQLAAQHNHVRRIERQFETGRLDN